MSASDASFDKEQTPHRAERVAACRCFYEFILGGGDKSRLETEVKAVVAYPESFLVARWAPVHPGAFIGE